MWPQVPPDERVVLERVRLDAALDEQLELLEARERRREPAARHRVEDLRARRGEGAVAAVAETGVWGRRPGVRGPPARRGRRRGGVGRPLGAGVEGAARGGLPARPAPAG